MAAEAGAGTGPPPPFAPTAEGLRLAVRLTPRGGLTGLDGVVDGPDGRPALRIRVDAPAVDGAANLALVAFLAKALGLRKSDIRIASGERSRRKLVEVRGDPERLTARLRDWLATP